MVVDEVGGVGQEDEGAAEKAEADVELEVAVELAALVVGDELGTEAVGGEVSGFDASAVFVDDFAQELVADAVARVASDLGEEVGDECLGGGHM